MQSKFDDDDDDENSNQLKFKKGFFEKTRNLAPVERNKSSNKTKQ